MRAEARGTVVDSGLLINATAAAGVLALLALAIVLLLRSRRLSDSSLFNRLFVVVAATSAAFSAVSSAIGFQLITSQEADDVFRNAVLPAAFGAFVFVLAAAIWVGGADLVRRRDWFRSLPPGPLAVSLRFIERSLKLFIVIPLLSTILFFVSTWTTAVGVGGVDAVRYVYGAEFDRLDAECSRLVAYRQRDFLFLEDLRLGVADVRRVAENEALVGGQTGAAGRGRAAAYFEGVGAWLAGLEASVESVIAGPDPSGVSPYDPAFCAGLANDLRSLLAADPYASYDAWSRAIETRYNDAASLLNRWRRDRRIELLLDQQLASFDRANPLPSGVTDAQSRAIRAYAEDVRDALSTLIRKQKAAKPPAPLPSADALSPARGLEVFVAAVRPPAESEQRKVSRTAEFVYDVERVAPLSSIGPRDAILKNANVFSDIWALAIAWDYASYILMLAFLFFPSAEKREDA